MRALQGEADDAAEPTAVRQSPSGGPVHTGANVSQATAEVGNRLRTMILQGALEPGSVLSQVALARQLGVSTTPVREAIRLLEAEGLLITERNRRARVPPLEIEDLDAVYSSRVLLESTGEAHRSKFVIGPAVSSVHAQKVSAQQVGDVARTRPARSDGMC